MPTLINIKGISTTIDDPFYRYKMEEVIVSTQRGKIVFSNIDNICENLMRSVHMLVKYLKSYFATSILYKNKMAIISKQITQKELQTAIYKFIDEFVLCRLCLNPETELDVKKEPINMICKSCGHKSVI